MKMFSVYDVKAQVYGAPFTSRNSQEALRNFQQAANDEQTLICKYPDDFFLYQVADFDDQNGVIIPEAEPIKLGVASEYQQKKTA